MDSSARGAPGRSGGGRPASGIHGDPCFHSILRHVPEAAGKIVHDPFHFGRLLNQAVDQVRKGEHQRLREEGDQRPAKSKYLWLHGWERVPESQQRRFWALCG